MEKLSIATTNTLLPLWAAQYVRMSTEHQQYSPENQLEVIREYAASHKIEIMRDYSDPSKTNVAIGSKRLGLSLLRYTNTHSGTNYRAGLLPQTYCWISWIGRNELSRRSSN
jgi:hypothetical protein